LLHEDGRTDRNYEANIEFWHTFRPRSVYVFLMITTNSGSVLVYIRGTATFSVREDVELKYNLHNFRTSKAVPWFRPVVAGLSPRRTGFDTTSVRARYVMDKVALGQAFLRVILPRFSPIIIISPKLHSHSIYMLLLP